MAYTDPRLVRYQYINIPLTSIAIFVVAFVLPLKRVKGNVKEKLLKIDYYGSVIMLCSATLILIPLSWCVSHMLNVLYSALFKS